MKKRLTKYLAVLCVLACMFSLSGCGKEEKNEKITYSEDTEKAITKLFQGNYDADSLTEELLTYYILNYTSSDRDTLEDQYKEYEESGMEDESEATALASYLSATDGVGEYQDDYYNLELEVEDEEITLGGTLSYEKREVMFTFSLDMEEQEMSLAYEKDLTTGEILVKAGKNTLLGMGTVFVLLIVISAIISCLKYVNVGEKKEETPAADNKKTDLVKKEVKPVVTQPSVSQDEEVAAVIAAAIAAAEAEQGSSDGFRVRSIKRVNNAKWHNV